MYSRRRGAAVAGIGAAADAAADAARDIVESQPVEDDPRLVRGLRGLCLILMARAANAAALGWPRREATL